MMSDPLKETPSCELDRDNRLNKIDPVRDERPSFEAPYNTARRIVCEEWHAAVKEFGLTPNSVTERVVSRIIERLDGTAWPNR